MDNDRAFQSFIAHRSVGGMLGRALQRSNLLTRPAIRNDTPMPWRMDWGGHDPATPLMEFQSNCHQTSWATMIGINVVVIYLMRKV